MKGQETLDSNLNKSCWTLTYKSFERTLGVSPANFQLILPFIAWDWKMAPIGNTNDKEYNLLNSMPVWNDTGKYQSGSDFTHAYETFLFILVSRLDTLLFRESKIQKLIMMKEADEYAKLLEEARQQYEEDKDALSFKTWLNNPYSPGYVYHEKLMAERKNLETQDSLYSDYLSQLRDTLLIYSRERFEKEAYRTKIINTTISNSLFRPAYSSIGDAQEWLNGKDLNSLHVNWEMKDSLCGLKLIELDSGKEHSFTSDSVSYQMVIENWDVLPVKPLPWFNESIINAKGNNPNAFRQGYTPYNSNGNQKGWIFGKGGIISARVTDLLVGYRLKLMITSYSPSIGNEETFKKGENYVIKNGDFVLDGKIKEVTMIGKKCNFMIEYSSDIPFFFGVYFHRY